jgi:uncharacterized protein (TIGR02001 family)
MTHANRFLSRTLQLVLALVAFSAAGAEEPKKDAAPTPDWAWTGHVDLNSAYYLRGITNTYGPNKWIESGNPVVYGNVGTATTANNWGDAPESRNPAVQWGFDITHSSGLYLGYWASQLTYSYKRVGESYDQYKAVTAGVPGAFVQTAPWYDRETSIENDFYGGYTGKVGEVGYNVGLTYYYYLQGKYSNAPETKVALTYGDFTAQSQTLLEDTIWGNRMDTYWTLAWTKALPYDITFTANAGYYTDGKEGKFLGTRDTTLAGSPTCGANAFFFVNGCYGAINSNGTVNSNARAVDGAFRHLILGISQPIGGTGLTWNAQAIIGGYNRFNIKQGDKVTVGISYAF